MALMRIEFKDKEFKEIMEDLRKAEDLTIKAYRRLQELGVVSVEEPASEEKEESQREKLYENIDAAYKEMNLFDAIGVMAVFLKKKTEAALNASEEARKSLIVDIAAQAKVGKAASKMIDENELLPEQKTLLKKFIKDLEDVKRSLSQDQHQDAP